MRLQSVISYKEAVLMHMAWWLQDTMAACKCSCLAVDFIAVCSSLVAGMGSGKVH